MRAFLLCLLTITCGSLMAQDSLPGNKFSPSLTLFGGVLPKTYPTAPPTRHASLASLGINWQLNGKDKWHQLYNYPKIGFDLVYGSFDNRNEIGYTLGFVPSLEIKSRIPKKWRFRFGFGAAYFNKPYNVISNTNNYYIGTHFTNMTAFSLFWKRQ